MNISQLYSALRIAIGRGTSVDTQLQGWCAEAINELETEATYKWMEKEAVLSVSPGLNTNVIALPSTRVKSISFIRGQTLNGVNGAKNYGQPLTGTDPFNFLSVDEGTAPGAFYIRGVSDLVLDGIPAATSSLWMVYHEYTEWPDDEDATPAILARHYAGVKALAMSTAAKNLRDARLAEVWSVTAERAKGSMWIADGIDGKVAYTHQRGMAQRAG